MANPFDFTAGAVLTAAQLNSIGDTTSYTPTSSNGITTGNGTFAGTYQQVNNIVIAQASFTLGSTSAISTFIRFSAPVTAVDAHELAAGTKASFYDTSANVFYPIWGRTYNTSETYLYSVDASGSYAAASSNWPVTAANTDVLYVQMTYRVA